MRSCERAKREEALIFCNRRIYVEKLVNVVTKALQVTFSGDRCSSRFAKRLISRVRRLIESPRNKYRSSRPSKLRLIGGTRITTSKIPGRKKNNGKPGNDACCCNLCNEEPGKPSGGPRYVENRCLHCRVSWSVTADSYAVDIVIMERVRVPLCLSRYRKRDCPSLLARIRFACNFPRKSNRFFFSET